MPDLPEEVKAAIALSIERGLSPGGL
jgi:hypothetical protein